jgi:hypothetical protein
MEASFQRLTLRQMRRIVPFMFSMILVQASERRSSAGKRPGYLLTQPFEVSKRHT